jgi:predicted TIM-barrel enzyme
LTAEPSRHPANASDSTSPSVGKAAASPPLSNAAGSAGTSQPTAGPGSSQPTAGLGSDRGPGSDRVPGRAAILQRLRDKVQQGRPILGAGAGTGISAKCEEAGGIDLIVIYNSGRYRMAGRGSLAGLMPYGNANQIVREMAHEVLTIVRHTPVLAGVCATDPFMLREPFLRELKELGFAGIQNFPTVGLIDGLFRANLEETGMSYALEVDCIRAARDLDLLTTPYVFNTDDARQMTEAGADIIVAHMGLTTSGSIGALTTRSLEQCVDEVQAIIDTCKSIRDDVLVLCHGGPIANPEDADFIFRSCRGVDGFYGASSMERLPTEVAITRQIQQFGELKL